MGVEWCACKESTSRGGVDAAVAVVACDESGADSGFGNGDC
jgi:hypothetical protein